MTTKYLRAKAARDPLDVRKFKAMLQHLKAAAAGRGYLLTLRVGDPLQVVAIPDRDTAPTWTHQEVVEAIRVAARAFPNPECIEEPFGRMTYRMVVGPELTFRLSVLPIWTGGNAA